MPRRLGVKLLAILLLPLTLEAQDWPNRSFMTWTLEDIRDILNNSPWIHLTSTSFPVVTPSDRAMNLNFPVLRFLSASPVRLALLRAITLGHNWEMGIEVRDLLTERDPGADGDRLLKFVRSSPNHLLLGGNSEFIVISLMMQRVRVNTGIRSVERWDDALPDEFEGMGMIDLAKTTYLGNYSGGLWGY